MVRCIGLHDDAAWDIAAAGPAGCLGQELEGPLASPVSRDVEQAVCRQDADGTDAGKIMTFGNHLRS